MLNSNYNCALFHSSWMGLWVFMDRSFIKASLLFFYPWNEPLSRCLPFYYPQLRQWTTSSEHYAHSLQNKEWNQPHNDPQPGILSVGFQSEKGEVSLVVWSGMAQHPSLLVNSNPFFNPKEQGNVTVSLLCFSSSMTCLYMDSSYLCFHSHFID